MNDACLPSGWSCAQIADVTEPESERVGRGNRSIVLSSTKHYGLIPSDEFFKNRAVYSEELAAYKTVRRNWFAYATNHLTEGSIGIQAEFDMACVSPVYTVFSCKDNAEPAYLFRVLKSPQLLASYAIHEQASVDRRGAVRYRDFATIEIDLPPLAEQRRIAEILDALDSQLLTLQHSIEKRENIRAGVLTDSLRAISLMFPASGWQRIPLGNVVFSVDYGISHPLVDQPSGVPVLRMNNVGEGRAGFGEIKYCSADVPRDLLLRGGDVLFNRTNSVDHVGRSGMWRRELPEATFASYLVRLNVDSNRLLPEYLSLWLSHPAIRQRVRAISTPAVQQVNVNPTILRSLLIDLPRTLDDQQQMTALLDEVDQEIACEKAELDKLRLVKQGLMEDLLTGKTRVTHSGRLTG